MLAHHALRTVAACEIIARDLLALTGLRVLNDNCYVLLTVDDFDAAPAKSGFDYVERLNVFQQVRFDVHLIATKKRLGNLIGR